MNSANFFELFDPVGPEFLKEPFPNREVHGAGVEDTIERLIGHELDHSDHEKESKKDFAPALVALQAERHSMFEVATNKMRAARHHCSRSFLSPSSTFGHAHSLPDYEPGSAIAISPTRIRVRGFNKGRRIAQRSKFPNLGGIY